MANQQTYELGDYHGRSYLITRRMDPTDRDPDDWAVTVHYRDRTTGEAVEVAKVDNAHGQTHIHRFYRREDPREPVDWGPWEAMSRLMEKWKTFAEEHEKIRSQ